MRILGNILPCDRFVHISMRVANAPRRAALTVCLTYRKNIIDYLDNNGMHQPRRVYLFRYDNDGVKGKLLNCVGNGLQYHQPRNHMQKIFTTI